MVIAQTFAQICVKIFDTKSVVAKINPLKF